MAFPHASKPKTHRISRRSERPFGGYPKRLEEAGLTRKSGATKCGQSASTCRQRPKTWNASNGRDGWTSGAPTTSNILPHVREGEHRGGSPALDEKTPHMHVTLVPIVKGERKRKKREEQAKKRYRKKPTDTVRLCADDIMSRLKRKPIKTATLLR